jgi:hypothetical protein
MQSPKQLFDFLEVAKYASQIAEGGDFDLVIVSEPSAGTVGLLCMLVIATQHKWRKSRR